MLAGTFHCSAAHAGLRNLKQLSYTSVVGSFFVVAAMVITIIYGIIYNADHFKTFEPDWVSSGYFKAFGSVAFLYCIHVLILPIERAMIRHTKFLHTLSSAFAVMATFNTLFALFCYFFWGEATSDFILTNLMRKDEDGELYYDALGIIVVSTSRFRVNRAGRPSHRARFLTPLLGAWDVGAFQLRSAWTWPSPTRSFCRRRT